MGGSYPRTENDIIEKEKIETAENNQRYLDHMKESIGHIIDEPRREIIPSHSNLKLPAGIIRASRAPKSEILEVPDHGQVDVSRIDTYIPPATGQSKGPGPVYEVIAMLEMRNSKNRLPNFEIFSQREDMAKKSRPEQVKEYLDLRQGIANKAAIETQTGINIDISALSDPVKSRTILSDPSIVQTFSKVKEIGVSPAYFKGVVLIDLEGTGGGREVERVRAEMKADVENKLFTRAAYNTHDRYVYINQDLCTPSFVNNGGLYHEMFHGLRLQETGDIGLILGIDKKHPAVPVIESCEDAAENIRTARFMGGNKGFNEILFQKYGLNPSKSGSFDKFIYHEKEVPLPTKAEAIATFHEVDKGAYGQLMNALKFRRGHLGEDYVQKIQRLSENFYRASGSKEDFVSGITDSLKTMGFNLPENTIGRLRLKKFSSFTLEERV
ncbi:hypothetical protein A3K73_03195 [Candidatus Pacearchaeota archaeon RBG_13_36_9]|nr:MAG: hypothetical protein A3K73_03195 [Candidatus Pacearchaeota archaeon RBG_13_36_9]